MSPLARALLRGTVRDEETVRFRFDESADELVLVPNHEEGIVGDATPPPPSDEEEEPLK